MSVTRPVSDLLSGLQRASRGISLASAIVAGFAMIMMIGVIVFEVFMRRVMGSPQIWTGDISFMLNGALFMLASAWALHQDAHVRIDVFSDLMPKRIANGIQAVFLLCLVTPALSLGTWYAISRTERAYKRSSVQTESAWEPLLWPFLSALTLGLILLLLAVVTIGLHRLLQALWGQTDGK